MASHSKEVLLKLLESATIRSGWGGVLALNQAVLNMKLREQFLEALGERTFIEPLILEAELDEGAQQSVSFQGVVFGEPQISFVRTLPTTAEVTVRFNVIAGDFARSVKQVARPGRVVESFSISEGMGYWVQAQASLRLEQGSTHPFASVVLDLGEMQDVTTNLASTDYANTVIGRELQEAFGYIPAYRRSYAMVRFDLRDFAPLSPERMMLRTQAAPWGADAGKNREGDGALLVFMKLGVDVRAGGQPDPEFEFPYLIPEEAVGLPATLILDPTIEALGAGGPLDVLRTIKVGIDHVFSGKDIHHPLDWVIFGDWQPGENSLAVHPGVARILAGQPQAFQLQGAPGEVGWQASNLFRPAVSGTFQGSTYTARGAADFVQDQQLVVVTARCQHEGVEVTRHALVQEGQAVSIAPRMASWVGGQKAIELRADSLDGGELRWELLGIASGVLTDLGGGKATFQPDKPDDVASLIRVQHIQVTDKSTGERAICSVVIMDWPADLVIEPGHVGQLQSGVPINFSVSNSNRPIKWSMLGEGNIDQDTGTYIPNEESTVPVCVIIADDDDERAGYAMVEFVPTHGAAVPHKQGWTDLATFELVVIGHDTCYANGWQQIEVEVRVEAQTVGGQDAIVSDAELATLQLMVMGSDNTLPFLQAHEGGIGKESGMEWAVSRSRNDVDPPSTSDTAVAASVPVLGDNERRVRFFIHSRQATTLEIYAGIQNADSHAWTYSKEKKEGKVNVKARPALNFAREQYGFERVRLVGESDASPIAGDDFIYVDNTMDYWRLKHVVAGGVARKFISAYIPPGANKSLLRWASEQADDHYCSYTGLQFIPFKAPESEHQRLLMDGLLYRMAKQRSHVLPELNKALGARAGELMISLRRTDAMKHWDDIATGEPYYSHLKEPITIELIDQQGHQHTLHFDFGVPEGEDKEAQTRDCLILTL
ncbi:hypothetical protein [Pseudomonas monteilii]|uniref:hypothetical protein n=1 Tax=Pseudomonas monteilii TaxID=76759 RepID=UPI001F33BE0E|nr:hypothetical protein [Pseudomonas monteilii]